MCFVIAQVARRDPMKGYDVLVDAMRRVAQLTCLAVGRGTHKLPEIEGLMAIGERDDVPRLLSGIDVLISCSLYGEGSLNRSEEPTSELQSLMRISYAVFCL